MQTFTVRGVYTTSHWQYVENSKHLSVTVNNKPIFVNVPVMVLLQINSAQSDSICQLFKSL